MPFPEEAPRSPCVSCEHRDQDKKKFEDCIQCEKRFGIDGKKFRTGEGMSEKKAPASYKQIVPTKPCEWPHGCDRFSVKSRFCYDHQRIYHDRMRRYKGQGMSKEEALSRVFTPIQRGKHKDRAEVIQAYKKREIV